MREAFEVLETHVDRHFARVDQRFNEVNAKLDTIMRHLTGMNPE